MFYHVLIQCSLSALTSICGHALFTKFTKMFLKLYMQSSIAFRKNCKKFCAFSMQYTKLIESFCHPFLILVSKINQFYIYFVSIESFPSRLSLLRAIENLVVVMTFSFHGFFYNKSEKLSSNRIVCYYTTSPE